MKTVLYPDFYFRIEGGGGILSIIIMVGLVLGPVLTVIVYNPGKPGLKFDISVIVALQVATLLYGVHLVYQERPLYLVNTGSLFRIVAASEIDVDRIRNEALKVSLFDKPKLVYAHAEDDVRQDILWDAISGGRDLDLRPEHYEPLSEHIDEVRKRALPLTTDILDDQEKQALDSYLSREQASLDDFLYYHLKAKKGFYLAVFSKDDFQLKAVLDIDAEEI
ncbi:MAG: hypothetical protein R3208_10200 [Ketobacteraceae bacterium]|nr:hypothetical protein [Ketobacteraceae bacterium]